MKLISTKKIILSKKTWKEYEDNLFKKAGYEDQEQHDRSIESKFYKSFTPSIGESLIKNNGDNKIVILDNRM
ncbi:MAG: hypothetical protein V3V84_10020 [Candidatus Bathyarchaeia archaeon]|jgi:hypothetical protein